MFKQQAKQQHIINRRYIMSKNTVTQKYFVLFDQKTGFAVDRNEDGFRFEYPGWNLKYYFWFTAEEVDSVIEFLEQNGHQIRRVPVSDALVKESMEKKVASVVVSPVAPKIPYALSII
jgi:hypothetical protein